MLGVTVFGLFFTPVFYVLIRRFTGTPAATPAPAPAGHDAAANGPASAEPAAAKGVAH
jgi:hypothetical protein